MVPSVAMRGRVKRRVSQADDGESNGSGGGIEIIIEIKFEFILEGESYTSAAALVWGIAIVKILFMKWHSSRDKT